MEVRPKILIVDDERININVLVDLAHQASFFTMWSLPRGLRTSGFRSSGSQATLDTVLTPGEPSRVRIAAAGRRPFAWWPNPRWNVVITSQSSPRSQDYLPEERKALFDELVARMYEIGKATEAASHLEIDAVIDPADTRCAILRALKVVDSKAR